MPQIYKERKSIMKQNTTPTVSVSIPVPLNNISRIEFIFKKHKDSIYPTLLHKVYNRNSIPLASGDTSENFVVLLPFTADETMNLPVGEVYMDTLIVMTDGSIPPTNIVQLDITATLFGEAG